MVYLFNMCFSLFQKDIIIIIIEFKKTLIPANNILLTIIKSFNIFWQDSTIYSNTFCNNIVVYFMILLLRHLRYDNFIISFKVKLYINIIKKWGSYFGHCIVLNIQSGGTWRNCIFSYKLLFLWCMLTV